MRIRADHIFVNFSSEILKHKHKIKQQTLFYVFPKLKLGYLCECIVKDSEATKAEGLEKSETIQLFVIARC